jgi:putative acetyltransferase
VNFDIRRATLADVDDIAAAHRDSIESIGPEYYTAEVVKAWSAGITGELYANAMAQGEVFFVAAPKGAGDGDVLGFSSHRVDDDQHGTSVYMRGAAARRGVGTALFGFAEASALAAGAREILIDASLAAVDFYKANGFEEVGRGEHRLLSGVSMSCVFMRKMLIAP